MVTAQECTTALIVGIEKEIAMQEPSEGSKEGIYAQRAYSNI
jgi:hypothetical protein